LHWHFTRKKKGSECRGRPAQKFSSVQGAFGGNFLVVEIGVSQLEKYENTRSFVFYFFASFWSKLGVATSMVRRKRITRGGGLLTAN
jgi:hypothetical protein